MDPLTFQTLRRIVRQASGIRLDESKQALVRTRVAKRMRALGVTDYKVYLRKLRRDETGVELVKLVDAISTNVTWFFREAEHFEFVTKVAAKWLGEGQTRFRLWSAGCATGEEAFSLGMAILGAAGALDVDLRILATDISTAALAACRSGLYPKDRLDSVPTPLKRRYFEVSRAHPGHFAVKEDLRRRVVFQRLNLAEFPYPMRGPFDFIFCRNVLMYLDPEIAHGLSLEAIRLLRPGGYLVLGTAESPGNLAAGLQRIRPSVYVSQARAEAHPESASDHRSRNR